MLIITIYIKGKKNLWNKLFKIFKVNKKMKNSILSLRSFITKIKNLINYEKFYY